MKRCVYRLKKKSFCNHYKRMASCSQTHMTSCMMSAQDLLAPPRALQAGVGMNIARRQPDVEIMCMLMSDLPLTSGAFDRQRKSNDWVNISFSVVAVSTPGFSSVPYSSTKKPGEKDENTKALYTMADDGKTIFHTYEKAKNNKDRGSRVSHMKIVLGSGETEDVESSCMLAPGVCLSTFLREDTYSSASNFFVPGDDEGEEKEDVIKAGSFVYVQVGTKNVDQASKGQILKFKKIKPCTNASAAVAGYYRSMPTDYEACKLVCQEGAQKYPALAKQINQGNRNFLVGSPCNPSAFMSYVDSERKFVLSDYELKQHAKVEVAFDEQTLLREHGFSDPARFVRWINMAIASNAVGVVALGSKTMDGDLDSFVYKGGALHVDVTTMLGMHLVQELQMGTNTVLSCPTTGIDASVKADDIFVWTLHGTFPSQDKAAGDMKVVFALDMNKRRLLQPWNDADVDGLVVTDGCMDEFHALSVYSVRFGQTNEDTEKSSMDDVAAFIASSRNAARQTEPKNVENGFNLKLCMSVQYRPDTRSRGAAKRKRPAMQGGDVRDDMDQQTMLVE